MSALILFVFLCGAVAAVPIAHALLIAAMAAAATSDRIPLDLLVQHRDGLDAESQALVADLRRRGLLDHAADQRRGLDDSA